jgi:GTPase SAR1 family protein
MIWDTLKEKFHSMIKYHYFPGTHGVIITFDVTDENSFKSNRLWYKEFENKLPYQPCYILVGTKCDKEQRLVTEGEGYQCAEFFNMKYFETSSKINQNITEAFNYLIREVIKAQQDGKFIVKEKPKIEAPKKNETKEGSCILI